jgi:small GTP-binding protein
VGIECFKKIHKLKNKNYLVKIWDTCGQERFKSLTKNYYRNAEGIILVFDLNVQETFTGLQNWLNCIKENADNDIPKVVIANKIDLDRTISPSQINKFSKDTHTIIFEASAKSDINTIQPFEYLITEVLKKKKKKDKDKQIELEPEVIPERKCVC